ncbi:hypothetical protein B0H13DRAFT_224987 [Mycena leptocephala]|nr:hypothetical protein B0H13DRAFT_224987 [Mycena leptocephala]
MAPRSPAVSMRIPSTPVSPRAPPDLLCRSYLRLAEPAYIPSHLYPNRASSGLSAQSCCSSCSGLCAAFSLVGLRLLKPDLYRHSSRTLLLINPRLLNRLSARIINSTRASLIEVSKPCDRHGMDLFCNRDRLRPMCASRVRSSSCLSVCPFICSSPKSNKLYTRSSTLPRNSPADAGSRRTAMGNGDHRRGD